MTILLALVAIIAGCWFLERGANWLVDGGVGLGHRLHISDLVIGLTVVAGGTSAPELVVSAVAAVQGKGEIALSNAIGSNSANILLILGLTAALSPALAPKRAVWVDMPLGLGAALLLGWLINDGWWRAGATNQLSRLDALLLLVGFAFYLASMVKSARRTPHPDLAVPDVPPMGLGKALLLVLLGLAVLVGGARALVYGAVTLATLLHVPNALIGVTIVAVGTSLPELATSVVAARRGNANLAMGNIVGSNLFNILAILGIAGTLRPLTAYPAVNHDLAVCVLASVLLLVCMFTGRPRHTLGRREGGAFLVLYAAYLGYLAWQQLRP